MYKQYSTLLNSYNKNNIIIPNLIKENLDNKKKKLESSIIEYSTKYTRFEKFKYILESKIYLNKKNTLDNYSLTVISK